MIVIANNVATIQDTDLNSLNKSIRKCLGAAAEDGVPLYTSTHTTVVFKDTMVHTVVLIFQSVVQDDESDSHSGD